MCDIPAFRRTEIPCPNRDRPPTFWAVAHRPIGRTIHGLSTIASAEGRLGIAAFSEHEATMTNRIVAGVAIPSSALARTAAAKVAASGPDILFRHAMRVFLFASIIGRRRELSVSPELLYVSALFLNVGLAGSDRHSERRFEVDSADAVYAFLDRNGVSTTEAAEAWCAVALHTSFGIHPYMAPLTALLGAGVETEWFGLHFDEVGRIEREAVLTEWPRGPAFKELLLEALGDGMMHRPSTTFGNVGGDVLSRWDPDFRRIDFCGQVLGSKWKD